MPFWWQRRRKWWWRGQRRRRYKRWPQRRKYKKRRNYRRRTYKTNRRRRRRSKKVRRKKKLLNVKIWQPETIKKCKIKGTAVNVLGVQGTQYRCYTDHKQDFTVSKGYGGGGFGVEKYTLQYLYEEYKAGNNIWTTSNVMLDLVRFTGSKFKFWRHPTLDFVGTYSRNYPMNLVKYAYAQTHPFEIMKSRHKFFIPSLATQPKGKRYKIVKIKPPRLMSNKWFFQESSANTGLVQLQTAVCDLRYPHLGCCNTNQLATILALNTDFYQWAGWGNTTNPHVPTRHQWYEPYNNAEDITEVVNAKGETVSISTTSKNYEQSISIDTGWWQPKLLSAIQIKKPAERAIPIKVIRYNPTRDTGVGTAVWLVNVVNASYNPPKTDLDLYLEGLPLWQLLFGFTDWVKKVKKDPTFLQTYYLAFKCSAIESQPGTNKIVIPVDYSFVKGTGPFGTSTTEYQKKHWYPTLVHQYESINNIVATGPFIPKLDNQKNSTWELYSNYTFYLKFGGAQMPDPTAADPSKQGQYDVPDKLTSTIQITNPEKQTGLNTIHYWDYRRGILTSSALKRIHENAETDSDISIPSAAKKKKKTQRKGNALQPQTEEAQEIESCLQDLYKENTFQEEERTLSTTELIQQQQQQQLRIRDNLLHLINNLKKKQQILQLQSGLLD
nr:MAG: ORF1 [Torque teno midi virus]